MNFVNNARAFKVIWVRFTSRTNVHEVKIVFVVSVGSQNSIIEQSKGLPTSLGKMAL